MLSLDVNMVVTTDDNKDYVVSKRINFEGNEYLLFSNINEPSDFLIQKEVLKLNGVNYQGVENGDEFDRIFIQFAKLFKEEI